MNTVLRIFTKTVIGLSVLAAVASCSKGEPTEVVTTDVVKAQNDAEQVVEAVSKLKPYINKDSGRIYFFGDLIGPAVNIFSTGLEKDVVQHTADRGSRDIHFALDAKRNMVFASNRVLKEDQAARKALGPRQGRPQDLNIYTLGADIAERERHHIAPRIVKTDFPEMQANRSLDGKWISFVRTVKVDGKFGYEELYIIEGDSGEPKKIATADLILSTDWAEDSSQLVFSTHSYKDKRAVVSSYSVETKKVKDVLDNYLALNGVHLQIDAVKLSPDGSKVAFISHPLQKGSFRILYVYDIASKKIQAVSAENQQTQKYVDWSSDSKQLVYSTLIDYKKYMPPTQSTSVYEGSGQIFLLDVASGESKQLTTGDLQKNYRPVFSPDDKLIAYMHADKLPGKRAVLRVMDTSGVLLDTLYEKVMGSGHLVWSK